MNRNSKKGFTIVELIIVIAVIAVLAAVLIPTFSNLIQKANEAKDTALVSNLNKAVAMDNGSKETVYDVLKVAEDIAGINVAKINAAANSNEILWDSVNKCFVYSVDGTIKYIPDSKTKDVKGNYDYWKLSSDQADIEANKYSIYWTGENLATVTATTGFDAGEAEIGKIIYKRDDGATAQTVTIRTNGGELEISAKPDTVYHYDVASKVVVTKVHNASYHEYGTVVGNLEVKDGHVELGAKANVSAVIVAPTEADVANVTVTTGATVGVVAATTDKGQEYLASATTVPSDKKAETKLDENVLSKFAGGIGTEASPYLIATADQFVKIADFNDYMAQGKGYAFALIDTIDLRTIPFTDKKVSEYFSGSLNGNKNKLIVNDSLSYVFMDAAGKAIFSNIEYTLNKKNVTLCRGMSHEVGTNVTFDSVNISSIDPQSTISIGKNESLFTGFIGYSKVKDKWCDNHRNTFLMQNCNVSVNLNGSSYNAVFIGAGANNSDVTVKDCTYSGNYYGEYVNLVQGNNCTDGSSGYLNSTFYFSNVKNLGGLYGTSRIPMIAAGVADVEPSKSTRIENCDLGKYCRKLYDDNLDLEIDDQDKSLVIRKAKADVNYYVLTFTGGKRRVSETTEDSSYRFSIKLKLSASDFEGEKYDTNKYKDGKLATVEQYNKFVDPAAKFVKEDAISLYNEDGAKLWVVENEKDGITTTYYVFEFSDTYMHFADSNNQSAIVDINSATITVYDSSNLPLAQKDLPLK